MTCNMTRASKKIKKEVPKVKSHNMIIHKKRRSHHKSKTELSIYKTINYIIILIILNMLKGVLYFKLETLTARVLGPMFRRAGQSIYRQGVAFQGEIGHEDRLVPSMRCIPISDAKYPRLLDVGVKLNYQCIGRLDRTQCNHGWRCESWTRFISMARCHC